jgi:hypothetical protein
MKMRGILGAVLLLSCLSQAADFQRAKVLEIRDASEVGANTIADSSEGVTGAPGFVPAMLSRCRLTVTIENTSYTAVYPVNKHLKITDFSPGDFISARIEGNKLIIKTLDGKELKAKVVDREPTETPKQEKSTAARSK